jgi:hypothetical protein
VKMWKEAPLVIGMFWIQGIFERRSSVWEGLVEFRMDFRMKMNGPNLFRDDFNMYFIGIC